MAEASEKSKKQSGGSKPLQSQPDEFVLYLDENLCNCAPVLEVLRASGVPHERHLSHFRSGTPDPEWLPYVGQNGWALLTRDQNIRYQSIEHSQVVRYKIREFVFKAGNLRKEELATVLMAALPQIQEACRTHPPPFIASVTKLGVVNMRFDENGPLHRRFAPKRKRPSTETDLT